MPQNPASPPAAPLASPSAAAPALPFDALRPGCIAIIGGGPAGLMAAETLAAGNETGGNGAGARRPVVVFDAMPSPGRKLLMAGRGGLNLTHTEPLPEFLRRYGPAETALSPAITGFPPQDLTAWCEGLGQPTFTGSSGRVFPRALKASPLLRAWLARLEGLGVRILSRHRWQGFSDDGGLRIVAPEGAFACHPAATLLALGGASWPRLGSDGAWTGLLPGTEIRPLRPANMGFRIDWSPVFREKFQGQPLKRIALSFGGRSLRGEAMITAEGIEGGAVYALSATLRDAIAVEGSAVLLLDLRPDLDAALVAQRLAAPRRGQSLSGFLRKSLALSPVAIGLVQEALHGGAPAEDLPRLVKAMPLRLVGTQGLERAISTAGGIALRAIDGRFMLRDRPGVFVAGEMLDWEAPTGGYLLQGCFSSGHAAARGLLDWLED